MTTSLHPTRPPVTTPWSGETEIFIGGCERSGTTLLGRLIAETAGLTAVPEAFFLHEALALIETGRRPRSGWRTATWGLNDGIRPPAGSTAEDLARWFRSLCRHYNRHVAGNQHYQGFVENSPAALHSFPLLRRGFGDHIKMITIIRDGRAVYSSWRRTDFGPATAAAAAEQWSRDALLSDHLARTNPGRIVCIRYEDLIADGRACVQAALAELGVAALDDCSMTPPAAKAAQATTVDEYARRHHALVDKAPDPGRADGWRSELPESEQIMFTRNAYAVLHSLGYDVEGRLPDIRPSPLGRIGRQLAEPLLQLTKVSRRAGRQAIRRLLPGR